LLTDGQTVACGGLHVAYKGVFVQPAHILVNFGCKRFF